VPKMLNKLTTTSSWTYKSSKIKIGMHEVKVKFNEICLRGR